MNIALVIERIEPWRGGAETSTMQFVSHLAKHDCRVTVVTLSVAPSTPTMTVVPIQARSFLRASRTRLFAARAAAYVRNQQFDVVHCITPCPAADVYQPRGGTVPEMLERNVAIRAASFRRGLKRLQQGLNHKYRIMARLEREMLARPDPPHVIAISHYVVEQLKRHYGLEADRVCEIFNGVDPDDTPSDARAEHRKVIRRQFKLADDDFLVLCVAHNFKLKGVGPLIEAVARCQPARGASRPYVVIVGRDNPTPYVSQAARLGIADRVFFAGPTKRIQQFFHAADCLAHPTFYDPCSRVVLEAMAAGLPVVTTRFNGAGERITEGREGYVIDSPTDVDALADRIGLLSDEERRRSFGRNAVEAVREVTMERHAVQVRQLYDDIVRKRRHRRPGGRP